MYTPEQDDKTPAPAPTGFKADVQKAGKFLSKGGQNSIGSGISKGIQAAQAKQQQSGDERVQHTPVEETPKPSWPGEQIAGSFKHGGYAHEDGKYLLHAGEEAEIKKTGVYDLKKGTTVIPNPEDARPNSPKPRRSMYRVLAELRKEGNDE